MNFPNKLSMHKLSKGILIRITTFSYRNKFRKVSVQNILHILCPYRTVTKCSALRELDFHFLSSRTEYDRVDGVPFEFEPKHSFVCVIIERKTVTKIIFPSIWNESEVDISECSCQTPFRLERLLLDFFFGTSTHREIFSKSY